MRRMTWLTTIAAAWLAACSFGNRSGNLTNDRVGSVGTPVERASPLEPFHDDCGTGALTSAGSSVIRRQPYVQLVTSSSAMVGWVSRNPDGQLVEFTAVDGTPVRSANAEIEEAPRRGREKQMWSEITGLSPDTTYCYRLMIDESPLSDRIGFRTAPTAESDRPIRILAFGDSGGGGGDQRALLERMHEVPYELIIHTGDLAYDAGSVKQFETTVFNVYADIFRSIPIFPAAGNHEYRTLRGAPFRTVFALPNGDGDEKWYSYDWGRIHFAVIDTEASYSEQARWLAQDLEKSTLPWKIVYMHRPPYSSGYHGSDMKLRRALAPVFEKYGVQLVIAGHDHNYERMKPQNGVAYVVTGGGGVGTRPVGRSDFTAHSDQVIHFLQIEVGIDDLEIHAIDANGREFDSTVITRQPAPAAEPRPKVRTALGTATGS
jgi:hypothetical protein